MGQNTNNEEVIELGRYLCSYCGQEMLLDTKITYKTPPPGVQDLKIVDRQETVRKCKNCGYTVPWEPHSCDMCYKTASTIADALSTLNIGIGALLLVKEEKTKYKRTYGCTRCTMCAQCNTVLGNRFIKLTSEYGAYSDSGSHYIPVAIVESRYVHEHCLQAFHSVLPIEEARTSDAIYQEREQKNNDRERQKREHIDQLRREGKCIVCGAPLSWTEKLLGLKRCTFHKKGEW